MKTLALLSLTLAVTLAAPPPPQQGHVEVKDPAPGAGPGPEELPVDMEQSLSERMMRPKVKVNPHIKVEQNDKVQTVVKAEMLHSGKLIPVTYTTQGRGDLREPNGKCSQSFDPMATGRGCCRGMVYEGKCYQFYEEPRTAMDAEFFCQTQFAGGHLASITSQCLHMAVLDMILEKTGQYWRFWIGGIRYLDTDRFIWLDGSQWGYADWLPGEPSKNGEKCVEILPFGKRQFNDMKCKERQAFICSFPDM